MAVFETVFDLTYLCTVVMLGIRLLMEKDRGAKLFGLMAVLLGLGDSFHLFPRVFAHFSAGGFAAHAAALSWGQFVTSITMTIFYVLFYFHYRAVSGDRQESKKWAIILLAALRIALVLLPQNEWGTEPGSHLFGILRNIPFAVMGGLLIVWTARHRKTEGLKHMSLLILSSFLFYVPVVLWSNRFPIVGALMLPKTVAYLLIVVAGFRYFIRGFSPINLLNQAFTALVMGLAGGVFYREATKYFGYTGQTHLSMLHVHTLVLGFLFLMMLYLFVRRDGKHLLPGIQKPLRLYLTGLVFTVVNMLAFGMMEMAGSRLLRYTAALSGLSGIGHILLAAGLIWLFSTLLKAERAQAALA